MICSLNPSCTTDYTTCVCNLLLLQLYLLKAIEQMLNWPKWYYKVCFWYVWILVLDWNLTLKTYSSGRSVFSKYHRRKWIRKSNGAILQFKALCKHRQMYCRYFTFWDETGLLSAAWCCTTNGSKLPVKAAFLYLFPIAAVFIEIKQSLKTHTDENCVFNVFLQHLFLMMEDE